MLGPQCDLVGATARDAGEVALFIRCYRFVETLCCALMTDQQTCQHYGHEKKPGELISAFHGVSILRPTAPPDMEEDLAAGRCR